MTLCGESADRHSWFSALFTHTLKKPRKSLGKPPKKPSVNPKATLKKP
jgi:hypothetical protein